MKNISLSTQIIAGYAIILLLFVIVTLVNFHLSDTVSQNSAFLVRSEAIIRNSAQLQRSIIDIENSFRGYLLTGKETNLANYDSNARTVGALYTELQSATPDTSFQTRVLTEINSLYLNWKNSYADRIIKERKEHTNNAEPYYLNSRQALRSRTS